MYFIDMLVVILHGNLQTVNNTVDNTKNLIQYEVFCVQYISSLYEILQTEHTDPVIVNLELCYQLLHRQAILNCLSNCIRF